MKKIILGFTALAAVMTLGTTTLLADDNKCGAHKCGTSKPAKCGGEKTTPKCGGDKSEKCGGDKKETAPKCGAGKCGGK